MNQVVVEFPAEVERKMRQQDEQIIDLKAKLDQAEKVLSEFRISIKAYGVDGLPELMAELNRVQYEAADLQKELTWTNQQRTNEVEELQHKIDSLPSLEDFE